MSPLPTRSTTDRLPERLRFAHSPSGNIAADSPDPRPQDWGFLRLPSVGPPGCGACQVMSLFGAEGGSGGWGLGPDAEPARRLGGASRRDSAARFRVACVPNSLDRVDIGCGIPPTSPCDAGSRVCRTRVACVPNSLDRVDIGCGIPPTSPCDAGSRVCRTRVACVPNSLVPNSLDRADIGCGNRPTSSCDAGSCGCGPRVACVPKSESRNRKFQRWWSGMKSLAVRPR